MTWDEISDCLLSNLHWVNKPDSSYTVIKSHKVVNIYLFGNKYQRTEFLCQVFSNNFKDQQNFFHMRLKHLAMKWPRIEGTTHFPKAHWDKVVPSLLQVSPFYPLCINHFQTHIKEKKKTTPIPLKTGNGQKVRLLSHLII